MHYRAISNTVSHLEVFPGENINTTKQKDVLTSFVMLNVLQARSFNVFQKDTRKDIVCDKVMVIDWQNGSVNVVAIEVTKLELLATKDEM